MLRGAWCWDLTWEFGAMEKPSVGGTGGEGHESTVIMRARADSVLGNHVDVQSPHSSPCPEPSVQHVYS